MGALSSLNLSGARVIRAGLRETNELGCSALCVFVSLHVCVFMYFCVVACLCVYVFLCVLCL